ncbi:MAG TPA: hypothetical protein ENF95_01655 [Candidatus Aenigmarchaeota archaeon]|nr:hypothetical protein [Candidatus Aenigmarchaeota archaeon]
MDVLIGLLGEKEASKKIFDILSIHQPFDYSGITTYDGNVHQKKGVESISKLFTEELREKLPGDVGIGCAGDVAELPKHLKTESEKLTYVSHNAQPEYIINPFIGGAVKGKITNWSESLRNLSPRSESQVQPLLLNLKENLKHKRKIEMEDVLEAAEKTMGKVKGVYSGIFITDTSPTGEDTIMFSLMDKYGITPLYLGEREDCFCFSSDQISLQKLGYKNVKEMEPGSVVLVNKKGEKRVEKIFESEKRPCIMNFIHTIEPNCKIGDKNVYTVRFEIGRKLFEKYPIETDVVCPIPERGKSYAEGFSYESGIFHTTGLIKVGEERKIGEPKKSIFIPNTPAIKNKNISLIDHNITENDTKSAIETLKESGAKEIHLYVACPPIASPCRFGIKTSEYKAVENKDVKRELGCDSVTWLEVDELEKILGRVCTDCLVPKKGVSSQ